MFRGQIVWIACAVPCIFAVAIGFLLMRSWNAPGVTVANYERIQVGMTVNETINILGPPSSFMMRGTEVFTAPNGSRVILRTSFDWTNGEHCVTSKAWEKSTESIRETLTRWINLR